MQQMNNYLIIKVLPSLPQVTACAVVAAKVDNGNTIKLMQETQQKTNQFHGEIKPIIVKASMPLQTEVIQITGTKRLIGVVRKKIIEKL